MPYRTCSVRNCTDKMSSRHSFPNPERYPHLFATWMQACGNTELSSLSSKAIYKSRKICHVHFQQEDIKSNNLLKRDAYPKLLLPDSSFIQESIPIPTTLPVETVYDSPGPSRTNDQTFGPVPNLEPVIVHTPKRRESTLLSSVGVTRAAELTPKACKLYKRAKVLKSSLQSLRKKGRMLRQRTISLSQEELLDQVTAPLKSHVVQFIRSQINAAGKKSQGRRYTIDDKILGLMLYKQSQKSYKFMQTLFALPSQKTLTNLLSSISILPGINKCIFDHLQASSQLLKENERICALMFDEMSIEPNISLNLHTNEFEGFENDYDKTSSHIANYVQVFMLKGITSNWKQPICYTFSKGTTKTINIVRMVKDIIKKCREINFNVVCTISDQGSNNQAAVNYLMRQTVKQSAPNDIKYFIIDDNKIFHIYDAPHLLKGIRNNLLKGKLVWENNGQKHIASWDDIEKAYAIDSASGELRAMPKLTDFHIDRKKLRKMKVSCASQVLSHTVASVIHLLSNSGISTSGDIKLGPEAQGTAKILKFFDNLFDSVNGDSIYTKHSKPLRTAITRTSPHINFWREAKIALKNMYFSQNGKKRVPPTLKNWICTINSIEEIFKGLPKEHVSFLRGRCLNQDPLENFFGQIRQRGSRNTNPTPTLFQAHFKTLLINNLATRHSIGANCEEDSSKTISSMKNFISQPPVVEKIVDEEEIKVMRNLNVSATVTNNISKLATGYVSGFIIKKLHHLIANCNSCKKSIFSDTIDEEWHSLILAKEYSGSSIPNKLKYCQPHFIYTLYKIYNTTLFILPKIVFRKNALGILLQYMNEQYSVHVNCGCDNSKVFKEKCIYSFVTLCCHNWVNGVNRLLSGKEKRLGLRNPIYLEAANYGHK